MIDSKKITSNLLIRNSLYSVVAKIVYVAIGFLIIPFLINNIGVESYGVWILVGSIFRYREVFSLGLNSAVNRYIPHYNASDNYEKVKSVINTAFIYYLLTAFLFIIVTFFIYFNFLDWFRIPSYLHQASRILVLVVGIGFALIIPLNLSTAILSSYQRYDIINIGIITHVLFRAIILVVLVMSGYGLLTIGIIFTISEILLKLFYIYFVNKQTFIFKSISFKKIDFKLLKEMINYGTNTFLYTISAVVIFRASDMIIGIYRSTEDITNYSVITVLVLVLHQILQAFLSVIKPAVSDLDARDNNEQINKLATSSQKYSLFFLIPASLFLIIFGREFLTIWVGESFSNLDKILIILTIGNFFFLSQFSNFFILVGKGEHKIFGIMAIITALIIIILSSISLGYLKLGLISVAISTAVPMIFITGIGLQIYFNNKMNIDFLNNIRSVWIPATIGCSPTLLLLFIWQHFFTLNNWLSIIIIVVISVITTIIGVWFFGIDNFEKKRIISFINK